MYAGLFNYNADGNIKLLAMNVFFLNFNFIEILNQTTTTY
jgi:hypothetical protein